MDWKKNAKCLAVFYLLISCFFIWTGEQGYAGFVDSNIEIAVDEDSSQNPEVIALPDHNLWFAVWESWKNGEADIYGSFITTNGYLCGSKIAISTAAGSQTVPAASYRNSSDDSEDKVLIVWQDTRGDDNSGYLYYRALSLGGSCSGYDLGTENAVSFNSVDGEELLGRQSPKVVYNPVEDQFLLTWTEVRDDIQRVSENCFGLTRMSWYFGDNNYSGLLYLEGDTLAEYGSGADIVRNTLDSTIRLISRDSTANQEVYEYEYFYDPDSLTATGSPISTNNYLIWEGVRQTGTLTCSCQTGDIGEEDLCDYNATTGEMDKVTSTWSITDSDDGLKHIYGIYDNQISLATITATMIDQGSSSTSSYPALSFDPVHRKYLAVWEDRRESVEAPAIYGQLIRNSGGLYGSNFPISLSSAVGEEDSTPKQTRPDISYEEANQRFFVTWQDGRNSSVSMENLDIYGQYVDSEGSLRGNNLVIASDTGNQYNPSTAFNWANHQYLTVWKDGSGYGEASTWSDIMGQRFSLNQGQLNLFQADGITPLVPAVIDFGSIHPAERTNKTINVVNSGDSIVRVDCLSVLDQPFIYLPNLPAELETCNDGSYFDLLPSIFYPINISFSSETPGTYNEQLTIHSDGAEATVYMQGLITEAATLSVVPLDSLDFGEVNQGLTKTLPIEFTNTGGDLVQISSIDFPGEPYSIEGDGILTNSDGSQDYSDSDDDWHSDDDWRKEYFIYPGESSTYTVTYSADANETGTHSSTLRVLFDNNDVVGFDLTGTTVYGLGISISPGAIIFPETVAGETGVKELTITNQSSVDLSVSSFEFETTGSYRPFSLMPSGGAWTVPAGESFLLTLYFNPSYSGIFEQSLLFSVSKGAVAASYEVPVSAESPVAASEDQFVWQVEHIYNGRSYKEGYSLITTVNDDDSITGEWGGLNLISIMTQYQRNFPGSSVIMKEEPGSIKIYL